MTRTVQRALQTAGGEAALARALEVSVGEIRSWLSGESRPASEIFFRLLDIVASGSARPRR